MGVANTSEQGCATDPVRPSRRCTPRESIRQAWVTGRWTQGASDRPPGSEMTRPTGNQPPRGVASRPRSP